MSRKKGTKQGEGDRETVESGRLRQQRSLEQKTHRSDVYHASTLERARQRECLVETPWSSMQE